ncbi:MAG TPA: GNAT family protein [Pirellulales bacterium]|nr:GNAT family protein [Pirellulales bacterium]
MSPDHEVMLTTDGLRMRPFHRDDAVAIYEAVCESNSELSRWLSWVHRDYALADVQAFLSERAEAFEKNGEYALAITDHSTDRLLGAIGINQIDLASLRGNLGYWVRTSAAGQGVATKATLRLATWAWDALPLERIEIVAASGNHASQRVAQKAGAAREGIARQRLRVHGVQHDAVVYSLVRCHLAATTR